MNLNLLTLLFLIACLMPGLIPSNSIDKHSESQAITEEGWHVLFDGTSVDQWRGYNTDSFPGEVWSAEDGMLIFRPSDDPSLSGKDIITREKYGDFELELEWWISERGNSGIFHHVVEQPGMAIYWSGIEMQIIDNDAISGLSENQLSGALYDMKPAVPQNMRPQGQWNTVRIISDGPSIQYWQNGELVVEYERWSAGWYEMVRGTKFECHPSFGNAPVGHIGLQDHGDEVRFRNIRIRPL